MSGSQDDIVAREAELAGGDTLRERISPLALHEGANKGDRFERWLVETLPQIPSTEIARAWRWQDSPTALRRRAFRKPLAELPDTGVDILAERHDGGLIAIQAKCLHPTEPSCWTISSSSGSRPKATASWPPIGW